ncbi:MAG: hypothetical protein EBV03_12600 [Proteobacteria bacterium]|nr:hypothetical protein [Pseudomonadota bacterium]
MADAFDAALRAHQQATQNAGGEKEGFEAWAKNVVSMSEKLAHAIPFIGALIPKVSNAGEVGVTKILGDTQSMSLTDKKIMPGGGSGAPAPGLLNMLGGAGKDLGKLLKFDLSGVKAYMEASPPENRSGADYFTPAIDHGLSNVSAATRSAGIDMDR